MSKFVKSLKLNTISHFLHILKIFKQKKLTMKNIVIIAFLFFCTVLYSFQLQPDNRLKVNQIPRTVDSYDEGVNDFGSFEVIEDGNTLQLNGNAWKKVVLNYTITPNTILEFDIKITGIGEVHGIGFDSNNTLQPQTDSTTFYQIAGTQTYGKQDYRTYSGNDWVTISIPVIGFNTGNLNNIVFGADMDADPNAQESFFRNIVLYESTALKINETSRIVTSYDGSNNDFGTFEVVDNQKTLKLNGNSWKKTDLNYTITENTVLKFDAKITGTGEVHGIGFDENNTVNTSIDNTRFFQVAGSQTFGIQDYRTYTGNEWTVFTIPIGEYLNLTQNLNYITLAGDMDSDPAVQESFFRNIFLYESTEIKINDTPQVVQSYGDGNSDFGTFEIIDDQNTIKLNGNAWKKTDPNFTITPDTMLRFDAKITGMGEVHGIGFDNDDTVNISEDNLTFFQIAGTETFGLQEYRTYGGNDWVSFSIPIGEFLEGDFNFMTFAGDKDIDPTSQESFFRNIIFENIGSTMNPSNSLLINDISEVVMSYDSENNDFGTFEIQDSGKTVKLSWNAWKKANLNYTVTPGTVIRFDAKITGKGEIHGIGFDNNDIINSSEDGSKFFQIAGTQAYGIQDYNTYTGNDWVSFTIPIGESFTGDFDYITFGADKDINPATQESYFKNITIYENLPLNVNGIPQIVQSYETVNSDSGTFRVLNNGNTIQLNGNAWKKALLDYPLSANTVISFDAKISGSGEIHGIGFVHWDSVGLSEDEQMFFQIAGTETFGIQDYKNYSGDDWTSYTIPVGEFFTSDYTYLTFAANMDSDPDIQESFFRNITLYESNLLNINDIQETVQTYHQGSNDFGDFEIMPGGKTIKMSGNAWKKSDFNYNIEPNTVLHFEAKITGSGEIHGIGFDDDDAINPAVDGLRFFQIAGTQTYGIQDYRTYSGGDWVSYAIPVGEYFTGNYLKYITFGADADGNPNAQESFFRNVTLENESAGLPPYFSVDQRLKINGFFGWSSNVTPYHVNVNDFGNSEIMDDATTVKITGNAWKGLNLFGINVLPNSILQFEVKIIGRGEIHGIGFDDDGSIIQSIDGPRFFQLAGSQQFGIQDYKNYSGSDWVRYTIPVGEFLTGRFNIISFASEKDSGLPSQQTYFRNLRLFETSDQLVNIIGKEENTQTVKVYPNPATHEISVDIPFQDNYASFALYSMNGSLIKDGNLEPNQKTFSISISDLESGLYLLNLKTIDGKTKSVKVIKQ